MSKDQHLWYEEFVARGDRQLLSACENHASWRGCKLIVLGQIKQILCNGIEYEQKKFDSYAKKLGDMTFINYISIDPFYDVRKFITLKAMYIIGVKVIVLKKILDNVLREYEMVWWSTVDDYEEGRVNWY